MNYNNTETDKPGPYSYMKLVSSIKDQPVPEDLKESIWMEVQQRMKSAGSTGKKSTAPGSLYYSLAGIAAVIATLVFLFSPETIETDFYNTAVKHGKGPVEAPVYRRGQDPEVDRVLEYCDGLDAEITELNYVDKSQMLSSIVLKINRKDYGIFREAYNSNNKAVLLPEAGSGFKPGRIRVQIYFPGRKYFIGDFNGDGYDDFGSSFTRDREVSKFYISINNTEGRFLEALPFSPGKTKLISRKDEILCGDINGDGYDDIVIKFRTVDGTKAVFKTFTNNKELHFIETEYSYPEIGISQLQKSFCSDINGDRLDDLVIYNYRGLMAGRYFVALNTGNRGFQELHEYKTGLTIPDSTIKYKALVMDINGDGFSDSGIYWQMGEKDAQWYFSLSGNDMKGSPELRARFGKGYMAFQGDYTVYTGDTDNDGYDELLVKAGTTDEISFWYNMKNGREGNFSSSGSLSFNGEEDIIVRQK